MSLADLFLDSLYPENVACLGCGKEGQSIDGLCWECSMQLNETQGPVCKQCGRPMRRRGVCRFCQQMKPPIQRGIALYVYNGMARDLILRCKFQGHRYLSIFFGRRMAVCIKNQHETPDVVVPVPSHFLRRLGRGYCVTWDIAQEVAKRLGIPMETGVLIRRHWRPSRFKLGSQWNEQMAARDYDFRHAHRIAGKRVLLVDDILTSGTTLTLCARCLIRAGAAEVVTAVVAASSEVRYNVRSKGSVVVSRSQSRAKRST